MSYVELRTWTPGFRAAMQWLKIWEGIWKGPESRGGVIGDLDAVDDNLIVPITTGKRVELQVGKKTAKLNRLKW